MIPSIAHICLFSISGGIGLIFAICLNSFLILVLELPKAHAYALVIPAQFALNFILSRRFVFGAHSGNLVYQSARYFPCVVALRILDWIVYVTWVYQFSIPFVVAQVANTLLFLLIRYKLAKYIFGNTSRENDSVKHPEEDGIVIGNVTDKSELMNPIAAHMVRSFDQSLFQCIDQAKPKDIHEIGCGEGRLAKEITAKHNIPYIGSDFSKRIIQIAQTRALLGASFKQKDLYAMSETDDTADTVICCEVLEHLDDPIKGLEVLKSLNARQYILSVPREPLWRVLNLARLKYMQDCGNTPGHLNHWSTRSFHKMLHDHGFTIETDLRPYPWTMVRGHFSLSETGSRQNVSKNGA